MCKMGLDKDKIDSDRQVHFTILYTLWRKHLDLPRQVMSTTASWLASHVELACRHKAVAFRWNPGEILVISGADAIQWIGLRENLLEILEFSVKHAIFLHVFPSTNPLSTWQL